MIRHKFTFGVGFLIGYTLGARAGRERYEQILRALRAIAENPAVQEAAGVLQAQASEFADAAKRTVTNKVTQTVGGRTVHLDEPAYPASTHTL
jgi:hypothetical protein